MTKKLYTLISSCVTAVGTIATAFVAYFQPAHTTAIIVSIGIATVAINDILIQFVTEEAKKK